MQRTQQAGMIAAITFTAHPRMNSCVTTQDQGFSIVSVAGEVDLSWSQSIRKAVLDALAGNHPVAVELSGVEYIDSSGIAALVEGFQQARGKKQVFGLLAISKPVRSVLQLARLDRVFPIWNSLADAQVQA